ncbi:hypothetical protein L3X38_002852 [Prunus dulcis]|uniref:Protein RALF-like 24 n=1 Tax=Prunus dulcis TaxID=3755 RepID=A0AAD4WV96_PRUDU|nr:hypothetical protein L3X38_002852 [Prunus dulcis]
MSKPRRPNHMLISCLSLLLIHTHFSICNGVSAFDLNSLKGSGIDGMVGAGRACNQKIGERLTEPEMESETSRRVLAMQKKYISYETLRRDLVPCGKPGASYYNCHAVAANPYSRGCEVITRCARVIGTEPDRSPHPWALHFNLFNAASVYTVKIYACENSHSKLQGAYKISLVADVLCSIWKTDDSFRNSSFISRQKLMSSPNVWPNVLVL